MYEKISKCELESEDRERLLDGYGGRSELVWFASHIERCEKCSGIALALEKDHDLLKRTHEAQLEGIRTEHLWDKIRQDIKEDIKPVSFKHKAFEIIEDMFAVRVPVVQYASIAVSIILLCLLYFVQPIFRAVPEAIPLAYIPASGTGEVTVESVVGQDVPVMVLKGEGDAAIVVLFEDSTRI